MAPQRTHKFIITLVVLGLLFTTSAGRAVATTKPSNSMTPIAMTLFISEEETDDEEDSGDGWFDTVVDTGGDVVGSAKDVIVDTAGDAKDFVVDTAGDTWDVIEDAPVAVWNFIQGIPGAIGGLVTSTWSWLRGGQIELGEWAEFLAQHPWLGAILGPIVELLIGLSPDGTISYLEIGLGLILFVIPGVKGIQALRKGVENLLPLANDMDNAIGAVRRNPGGLFDGMIDTYRLSRARSITPGAEGFVTLPNTPGVYVALDASGKPIYVGMSSSLSRRVPQHFDSTPSGFAGTTQEIKILPTKSVRDARALECTMIKTHNPTYNTVFNNSSACPVFIDPVPLLVP